MVKLLLLVLLSNDGNGKDSGHVRVYQYNSNEWKQIGKDIDGEAEDDRSGSSVSLSSDGKTVAIGAKNNYNDMTGYSGHVRVYQYNIDSNEWKQIGQDIDGEFGLDDVGDSSGYSVIIKFRW